MQLLRHIRRLSSGENHDLRVLIFGVWLSGVALFVGFSNYINQLLLATNLTATDFATFASLMSLVAIFTALFDTITMNLTRAISGTDAVGNTRRANAYFTTSLIYVSMVASIALLALGLASQYIAAFLDIADPSNLLPVGLIIVLSCAGCSVAAIVQARQQVRFLSVTGFLLAISKLLLCLALTAYIKLGAKGALFGVLLSITVYLFVALIYISYKGWFTKPLKVAEAIRFPKASICLIALANVVLATMCNADIIIVRNMFPEEMANPYILAAVLGKAIIYLPSGLILMMFAETSKRTAKEENATKLLWLNIGSTAVMGLAFSTFLYLAGSFIIDWVYDDKYPEAGYILSLYGFVMIPIAIIVVIEHFLIARQRFAFTWIFIFSIPFQIIALLQWGQHPLSILVQLFISSTIILLLGGILNRHHLTALR